MQAQAAWDAMRAMPVMDYADAFGAATVLVLAPHPDDESLGCGGLIAEACAQGRPPMVAILTDGSQSHPNSLAWPADRLRRLRESEALAATARLGLPPGRLVFLRYPDTRAPVAGSALREAAAQLADLIHAWGCRTVVTSWRHDPHGDHEAASAIAVTACRATGARLLAYPVWGWTLPPDAEIDQGPVTGFQLDIARHLPVKRAAILAHQSQHAGIIGDDPGGFQLSPGFIDRFLLPVETFIDVEAAP